MFPVAFSMFNSPQINFFRPEIWLEWWVAGDGVQKTLYVTVYFMLALFNSIGNGGYVW